MSLESVSDRAERHTPRIRERDDFGIVDTDAYQQYINLTQQDLATGNDTTVTPSVYSSGVRIPMTPSPTAAEDKSTGRYYERMFEAGRLILGLMQEKSLGVETLEDIREYLNLSLPTLGKQ